MTNQPNNDILTFHKSLAASIGLNESIVIQQIDYWIKNNEKNKRNFKDGYYWTYNSFEKWHEEFPFWNKRTIKRIFAKLEESGILVSANYNKTAFDRTKWYRINCDVLKFHSPLGQNVTMEGDKMSRPIPENTQRLTENGLNRQYNGFFQEKNLTIKENIDRDETIKQFIDIYMNDLYKQKTGKKHERIKKEQYNRVYDEIENFCYINDFGLETLIDIAIAYLNSDMYTDYNINHFANHEIMRHKAYECGYCPEYDF